MPDNIDDLQDTETEVKKLITKFREGYNSYLDEREDGVEVTSQVVAAAMAYFIADMAFHTGQPSRFMMALDVGVRTAFRGFEERNEND